MDRWICNDMIYIVNGECYGVTDTLKNIFVGTEAEVLVILGGSKEYEHVRHNMDRVGAYVEAEPDEAANNGYEDEGTTMSAHKSNREILQRRGRSELARAFPRRAQTYKPRS